MSKPFRIGKRGGFGGVVLHFESGSETTPPNPLRFPMRNGLFKSLNDVRRPFRLGKRGGFGGVVFANRIGMQHKPSDSLRISQAKASCWSRKGTTSKTPSRPASPNASCEAFQLRARLKFMCGLCRSQCSVVAACWTRGGRNPFGPCGQVPNGMHDQFTTWRCSKF